MIISVFSGKFSVITFRTQHILITIKLEMGSIPGRTDSSTESVTVTLSRHFCASLHVGHAIRKVQDYYSGSLDLIIIII